MPQRSSDSVDESLEEEDEVSDEEDDKFDIDDSSPEAAASGNGLENRQTKEEQALGMAKVLELVDAGQLPAPEVAARALHEGNAYMRSAKSRSKSRSRSRSRFRSNSKSGVDTPGRFVHPAPHPPNVSPRHVEFFDLASASSSESLAHAGQQGARDDIHSPRAGLSSGKLRIPLDRDADAENLNSKTPTEGNTTHGGRRAHHPHQPHHRAFAVWGQDESDSNASDSDA